MIITFPFKYATWKYFIQTFMKRLHGSAKSGNTHINSTLKLKQKSSLLKNMNFFFVARFKFWIFNGHP